MNRKRLYLTSFLIIVAGVSLLLNALLFKRVLNDYVRSNSLRIDPAQVAHYPLASPPPSSGVTRVVLLGDSRAEAWPAPVMPDHEFINRGIGGQTAAQVSQRFDAHVVPLEPDMIVVQVCINDLKMISFMPERHRQIIEGCKQGLRDIVSQSREIGASVILTTIFPPGTIPWWRRPFWSADIDRAVIDINAWMHTLAEPGVRIMDVSPILTDETGAIHPEFQLDHLHLTDSAYQALNPTLQQFSGVRYH